MGEWNPRKRVLVIVEGTSDIGFVAELLSKFCKSKNMNLGFKVVKMNGNELNKAVRIANSFDRYDLIVLLKDQHNYDLSFIEEEISKAVKNLSESVRVKFRSVIVRRAIESWALADVEGLRSICREVRLGGDPEEIEDPAEALRNELRKCGLLYMKTEPWGRRLAQVVDPERARRKSKSLNEFLRIIEELSA